MKTIEHRLLALVFGVAALTAGCNDDNNGSGPTSTSWIGILLANNSTDFGGMKVTAATAALTPPAVRTGMLFAATAPVAATADLNIVAAVPATLSLTRGTYDPSTNTFDITDQGYSFTGVFDGTSTLTGSWTGPGPLGVFVALEDDGTGRAYCGTFTGATGSGSLAFVVVNGVLAGNAYGSTAPLAADGTALGNVLTFNIAGGVAGTGTINGTQAMGSLEAAGGTTFTWTADDCTP